jgi:hypothetical protein
LPSPSLLPPPDVSFAADAGASDQPTITVEAKSDSGLSRLDLYEDGRLYEQRTLTGTRLHQTIGLSRPPHVRTITVVAVDRNGFKSRPMTLALRPKAAGRNTLHVLAIGVDVYDHLRRY